MRRQRSDHPDLKVVITKKGDMEHSNSPHILTRLEINDSGTDRMIVRDLHQTDVSVLWNGEVPIGLPIIVGTGLPNPVVSPVYETEGTEATLAIANLSIYSIYANVLFTWTLPNSTAVTGSSITYTFPPYPNDSIITVVATDAGLSSDAVDVIVSTIPNPDMPMPNIGSTLSFVGFESETHQLSVTNTAELSNISNSEVHWLNTSTNIEVTGLTHTHTYLPYSNVTTYEVWSTGDIFGTNYESSHQTVTYTTQISEINGTIVSTLVSGSVCTGNNFGVFLFSGANSTTGDPITYRAINVSPGITFTPTTWNAGDNVTITVSSGISDGDPCNYTIVAEDGVNSSIQQPFTGTMVYASTLDVSNMTETLVSGTKCIGNSTGTFTVSGATTTTGNNVVYSVTNISNGATIVPASWSSGNIVITYGGSFSIGDAVNITYSVTDNVSTASFNTSCTITDIFNFSAANVTKTLLFGNNCVGGESGSFSIEGATGGTAPYSYTAINVTPGVTFTPAVWSDGVNVTIAVNASIQIGDTITYVIQVTDDNSNVDTKSFTCTAGQALTLLGVYPIIERIPVVTNINALPAIYTQHTGIGEHDPVASRIYYDFINGGTGLTMSYTSNNDWYHDETTYPQVLRGVETSPAPFTPNGVFASETQVDEGDVGWSYTAALTDGNSVHTQTFETDADTRYGNTNVLAYQNIAKSITGNNEGALGKTYILNYSGIESYINSSAYTPTIGGSQLTVYYWVTGALPSGLSTVNNYGTVGGVGLSIAVAANATAGTYNFNVHFTNGSALAYDHTESVTVETGLDVSSWTQTSIAGASCTVGFTNIVTLDGVVGTGTNAYTLASSDANITIIPDTWIDGSEIAVSVSDSAVVGTALEFVVSCTNDGVTATKTFTCTPVAAVNNFTMPYAIVERSYTGNHTTQWATIPAPLTGTSINRLFDNHRGRYATAPTITSPLWELVGISSPSNDPITCVLYALGTGSYASNTPHHQHDPSQFPGATHASFDSGSTSETHFIHFNEGMLEANRLDYAETTSSTGVRYVVEFSDGTNAYKQEYQSYLADSSADFQNTFWLDGSNATVSSFDANTTYTVHVGAFDMGTSDGLEDVYISWTDGAQNIIGDAALPQGVTITYPASSNGEYWRPTDEITITVDSTFVGTVLTTALSFYNGTTPPHLRTFFVTVVPVYVAPQTSLMTFSTYLDTYFGTEWTYRDEEVTAYQGYPTAGHYVHYTISNGTILDQDTSLTGHARFLPNPNAARGSNMVITYEVIENGGTSRGDFLTHTIGLYDKISVYDNTAGLPIDPSPSGGGVPSVNAQFFADHTYPLSIRGGSPDTVSHTTSNHPRSPFMLWDPTAKAVGTTRQLIIGEINAYGSTTITARDSSGSSTGTANYTFYALAPINDNVTIDLSGFTSTLPAQLVRGQNYHFYLQGAVMNNNSTGSTYVLEYWHALGTLSQPWSDTGGAPCYNSSHPYVNADVELCVTVKPTATLGPTSFNVSIRSDVFGAGLLGVTGVIPIEIID